MKCSLISFLDKTTDKLITHCSEMKVFLWSTDILFFLTKYLEIKCLKLGPKICKMRVFGLYIGGFLFLSLENTFFFAVCPLSTHKIWLHKNRCSTQMFFIKPDNRSILSENYITHNRCSSSNKTWEVHQLKINKHVFF
jgi:hypothetical protein